MAISIDYIRPWTQLEATAGQTVFSTIWTADDATDILVYARASGVEARDVDQLVSSNDYTVQFIGAGLTVQVTFLVGRTLGDIITVARDTPADKMNLYQNTNFKPSMLNSDFERVVMMIQQSELYDKDLSPRYNTSETPYGVDENNPPNFNRIIDLYLPLLPPLHIWRKNAENTRIEAVLFDGGGGGGGGDDCCETTISQPTVGLELADWVRFDTGTNLYVPAMANNATNADVVGMVKSIADASSFQMQQSGRNDSSFTGLTEGNYFLSATQPGKMSLSQPMNEDEVSVPVFAADSPMGGWVRNFRGKVLGDDANPNDGKGNGQNWIIVTQAGHGFSVEEALYVSASNTYAKAIATSFEASQVAGLVVEVIDADNFVLQQSGWTTAFSAKSAPQLYWLSDVTPGLITTTRPTSSTSFQRPCFIAVNTDNGWILERWNLAGYDLNTSVTTVTQVGHGFSVEQFVRPSSTDDEYELSVADTIPNATGACLVIKVIDVNNFVIQQTGITNVLSGLTAGNTYYLDTTPGGYVPVEPTANGSISKPLILPINATTAWLLNDRPMLQPGANGGNGTSSYILLASQTVSGVTNIDFSTVFSANTGFRSYILRYEDVFGNSPTTQRLLVQVYIGGVLQTSGYKSSATTRASGVVDSPNTTAIQLNAATFAVYVGGSLAVASGGDLEFISPTTNGSAKICRGRGTFPINGLYGTPLAHLVECSVNNTANTSPYEGININSGGTLLLTGTFLVYGIV